jgi:hypothetical protein
MSTKQSTSKTQVKSLASKLVEIRKSLGKVEKTKRNPHFGYSYVGLEQLNALLEPKLTEHNIFLATSVVECEVHYGEPKAGVFASMITEHTFIDGDTGEKLLLRSAGLGWDAGDKATPKSATAANKTLLKSNFMISEEADDPEAQGEPPAAKPAGAAGHRRTRAYEEETGDDDKRVATDLIELKAFLTEHKIPDGFLLRLLQDKKLIDGHTKTVATIKPGILRRVLSPKSLGNLVAAWKQQQADEESGSQEPPAKERSPFDEPKEVRTREGDQTRNELRKPVDDTISPKDMLEQEGYDDWREVEIHFGEHKGKLLGKLPQKSLAWWINNYVPKPYRGTWQNNDLVLDAALCLASEELGGKQ